MAQWKQDPQSREDIEEVSNELELPIYKASALGKFRPWLKESWGKLEDYLINLKNIANSKEPLITKKTAFNLDKTNLTENDSNKLFTAKGALDLFNTLTTNFTNAVNSAKEYFRTELVKKIDKTSISSSLNSTSTATVLSSAGAKVLEDKKFNKSGGELTGNLKILSGDYSQIQLGNTAGEYLILQNEPASSSKTSAGRIILRDAKIELNGSAGDIIKIEIPKATGRMALEEWVNTQITWGNLANIPSFTNSVTSTSTDSFAVPAAVKKAYDKGIEAMQEAGTKVSKTGDTMTGDLNIKNGGDFSKIQLYNTAGQKLLIQSLPNSSDYIGNIVLRNADYTGSDGNIKSLFVPKKDGVLAITGDISKKHLEIVGKDYGGVLNTAGAKTAGKTYFDNNTKKLFLCKNNNSDTSANVNNYIALDNNSLLERLEKISNVSYLKKENGYLEINGFILQWGTGFTFAKPFPNACLRVLTSINTTGEANQNDDTMVTSFNKTGFTTLRSYYNVVYFAIGY